MMIVRSMEQLNGTTSNSARVGEPFDDFLIVLCELAISATTIIYRSEALHDKIIEDLQDGDIIQELLQINYRILDQAIM